MYLKNLWEQIRLYQVITKSTSARSSRWHTPVRAACISSASPEQELNKFPSALLVLSGWQRDQLLSSEMWSWTARTRREIMEHRGLFIPAFGPCAAPRDVNHIDFKAKWPSRCAEPRWHKWVPSPSLPGLRLIKTHYCSGVLFKVTLFWNGMLRPRARFTRLGTCHALTHAFCMALSFFSSFVSFQLRFDGAVALWIHIDSVHQYTVCNQHQRTIKPKCEIK